MTGVSVYRSGLFLGVLDFDVGKRLTILIKIVLFFFRFGILFFVSFFSFRKFVFCLFRIYFLRICGVSCRVGEFGGV